MTILQLGADMVASAIPVLLVLLVAILFACFFMALSYWLGPSKRGALKETPYECGIPSRGSIQIRFFIRFFMVALLFLVFDLVTVLLIPWVLTFRSFLDAGAGVDALTVMGAFLLIIVVGLFYGWRKGGLEWQ